MNPRPMEQSANAGDAKGVLGHTVVPFATAVSPLAAEGAGRLVGAGIDALPNAGRAGKAFQDVSAAAGQHTVPMTDDLSGALANYQQLVDAGGSRSLSVQKLINRVTDPAKPPMPYDEARMFYSNISRLSADES